jgi:hypothetical protein
MVISLRRLFLGHDDVMVRAPERLYWRCVTVGSYPCWSGRAQNTSTLTEAEMMNNRPTPNRLGEPSTQTPPGSIGDHRDFRYSTKSAFCASVRFRPKCSL